MQAHKGENLALLARVLGPIGALVATTKTNAEIIGVDDRLGTIESGKLADMILVNKNPLEDIGVLRIISKTS